jgi:hypothetical protein
MASPVALEWWKYTATGAMSALASGALAVAGFWFGGARDFATRDEVAAIVIQSSPWTHDKGRVEQMVTALEKTSEQNARAIGDLAKVVNQMAQQQSELIGELRSIRKATQ